jgi:hypothetical protein
MDLDQINLRFFKITEILTLIPPIKKVYQGIRMAFSCLFNVFRPGYLPYIDNSEYQENLNFNQ